MSREAWTAQKKVATKVPRVSWLPRSLMNITGPLRTLSQDIAFGIDQLAEIAIRALSPAANDTFTALTCIDWIGDSLCKIAVEWHPQSSHHDHLGVIRLGPSRTGQQRRPRLSEPGVRPACGLLDT